MQGRGAAWTSPSPSWRSSWAKRSLPCRNAPQLWTIRAAAETPDDIAPRLDQFARVRCRCRRAGAAPAEMTEQASTRRSLSIGFATWSVPCPPPGGHGRPARRWRSWRDRQPGEAPVGADSPGRLETIDIRHLHVHQHRVERHARLQHLLGTPASPPSARATRAPSLCSTARRRPGGSARCPPLPACVDNT